MIGASRQPLGWLWANAGFNIGRRGPGCLGTASFAPFLIVPPGEVPSLGDPLVDEYLRFTAAMVRPNTLTAQVFDLKIFFTVVLKSPRQ